MLAILGAGSWGTALALQAARGDRPAMLWDFRAHTAQQLHAARENSAYLPGVPLPHNLHITSDLQQCVRRCDTLLIAVPSHAFPDMLRRLKPMISAHQGLAWATKGLHHATGQLLHEVVQTELGKDIPRAVLSGPSFAQEVARQKPTIISLASTDPELTHRLVNHLQSDTFRIYTTNDLIGVCLAGAYKNILAIAAGIADGLELGHNARAALITRGLAEMQRLGLELGAQSKTFMGPAGLGDLVLTCTGDLSRNRRVGMALAAGNALQRIQADIGQVAEGIETARAMRRIAVLTGVEMPIAEEVFQVLHQGRPPRHALRALLSRQPDRRT